MPFLVLRRGSFVVHIRDHFQSRDHLQSGIFAALYTARRLTAFSIVHTDREAGNGNKTKKNFTGFYTEVNPFYLKQ